MPIKPMFVPQSFIIALFCLFCFSTSALQAQDVLEQPYSLLLQSKNRLQQMQRVEHLFSNVVLDKLHKNIDTAKNIAIQFLEKKLLRSAKNDVFYLIQAKLGAIYAQNKDATQSIRAFQNIDKVLPTQDAYITYYYHNQKVELHSFLKRRDSIIYHAQQMSEIGAELRNDSLQIVAYRALGAVSYGSKNYNDCRYYFKKVIDYCLQHKKRDVQHNAITLTNTIGLTYKHEKKYDSARYHYEKALFLAKKYTDTTWIGILLGNTGETFHIEKQYNKALPYLLQDLAYTTRHYHKHKNKKLNNVAINAIAGIAGVYMGLGDMKNAKMYLDSAQKHLPNEPRTLRLIYENWGLYYEKMGDYRLAYEYNKKYHVVMDTLLSRENTQKNNELAIQINFDKQRKKIEVLHIQTEKQAQENAQKNYILGGIVVVLGLSVGFIYFLYQQNLQRKRTNHLLSEQKAEITTQAEELLAMNEQLVDLDQFKQNLTSMIVHDLKNPLNALLNLSETPSLEQNKLVKGYSTQMLQLVLNILDVQKFEEAKMVLDRHDANLAYVLGEACRQVEFMAVQKNIELQILASPTLHATIDIEIITRIWVNLLTNALKYSPQNSTITLCISLEAGKAYCSVQDEGKGIPADKLDAVFQKFVQLEPSMRKNYRSTGLGLTYCKLAVEAHGGEIGVLSEEGKGAKFWFTLPDVAEKQSEQTVLPTFEPTAIPDLPTLTEANQALLSPFLPALSERAVYYTSELENILSQIDFEQNENLYLWGNRLKEAMHNFNQELYTQLLSQIKP